MGWIVRAFPMLLLAVLALLLLAVERGFAGEDTNVYEAGEAVRVYASKMGPLHNVLETFDLIRAPGCPSKSLEKKTPTFGQALIGEELYELNTTISFGVDVKEGVICRFTPTEVDVVLWKEMIANSYVYQLLVDELPIWALFGNLSGSNAMIYLHRSFYLGTNNHQIVNVTLETSNPQPIHMGETYTFTYSVSFFPSLVKFENRFAKYVDEGLFVPHIRWFALANSLILVLLLVLLVLTILSRAIGKDYKIMEYNLRMRDEGNDELIESVGWKQLYADVYRVPRHAPLLCSLIGSGAQLIVVFVLGISTAAFYSLMQKPAHSVLTAISVLYALTGVIAGFVSALQFLEYATLNPTISGKWMRCMEFTMLIFPLLLLSCGTITNVLSHIYESSRAVHIDGVAFLLGLLFLGFCPSVVVGTIGGRYTYRRLFLARHNHHLLPHVNQIPRLIPPPPSPFFSNMVLVLICGLLPFGSIVFELFLVLNSLWLNKLYYLYTFLLLTFFIFILVTSCVSISAVYVLLCIENHRWQWTSFWFGASSGLYVYLYAAYFYTFRTAMSGFFTFALYFIYSVTLSIGISLTSGSASFFAASLFVRKIYAFVKSD